ncbi:MAG: DUF1349 domain-containing protein [Planctomycetota bacterium]|nr:MAG: DUF1349 domain-containing protein [Planctomycetota bacterium]REJ97141.1 MAG: DUF1349 domain-containing protein [Planctomycetota bacterium]REK27950.1 MAG: DUF1349 domain-containing protein [Planctomycetota bacterium]REK42246.1 MAG: DUF1349 domain-containing protein [Planctomycetota bacterium]
MCALAAGGMLLALPATAKDGEQIRGWGRVIDPDDDCRVEAADGKLTITVPQTRQDIWYGASEEKERFGAPRVMQTISGDFVITVKVSADWTAGLGADKAGYNGAGLLIWDSPKQYLRLERNRYVNPKYSPRPLSFNAPLYDLNEHRTYFNATFDDFFEGPSSYLRMIRRGQKIVTLTSPDGKTWISMGTLDTEFPDVVQVGVDVVSSTEVPLEVTFEELVIEKR